MPENDLDRADGHVPAPAVGLMVGAVLLGVVTGLVAMLAWNAFDGKDEVATSSSTSDFPASTLGADETAPPSGAPAQSGGSTRLARCSRAVERLAEPLEAARPALQQWAVHVGAMNKLVVGEITLQQAMDFWDSTRVGAQRKVGRFDHAVEVLRHRGIDCPSPDLLGPGARALPSCAREVQAEVGALEAAETSLATWREHIHHMDMLRLGELSAEDATRMWLASWKRGVRELATYRQARRAQESLAGCPAFTSSTPSTPSQ